MRFAFADLRSLPRMQRSRLRIRRGYFAKNVTYDVQTDRLLPFQREHGTSKTRGDSASYNMTSEERLMYPANLSKSYQFSQFAKVSLQMLHA